MTWHFTPTDQTIDVYDHTGSLVAEDRSFSGSWSRFPDVVLDVMKEEAVAAFQAGDRLRLLRILADAAFEDIEEGTP